MSSTEKTPFLARAANDATVTTTLECFPTAPERFMKATKATSILGAKALAAVGALAAAGITVYFTVEAMGSEDHKYHHHCITKCENMGRYDCDKYCYDNESNPLDFYIVIGTVFLSIPISCVIGAVAGAAIGAVAGCTLCAPFYCVSKGVQVLTRLVSWQSQAHQPPTDDRIDM